MSIAEATQHWYQSGIVEGRQSNAQFSLNAYRNRNPDLQHFGNPDLLNHWYDYGRHEGRDAKP